MNKNNVKKDNNQDNIKIFHVKVTEILTRTVLIEAQDKREAQETVRKAISLNYGQDYTSSSYEAIEINPKDASIHIAHSYKEALAWIQNGKHLWTRFEDTGELYRITDEDVFELDFRQYKDGEDFKRFEIYMVNPEIRTV